MLLYDGHSLGTLFEETKLLLMESFDWPVTSSSQPNVREERVTKPEHYQSEAIRDGPLANLWGGGAGEVQKNYSRKGKLNEKKFMHAN